MHLPFDIDRSARNALSVRAAVGAFPGPPERVHSLGDLHGSSGALISVTHLGTYTAVHPTVTVAVWRS